MDTWGEISFYPAFRSCTLGFVICLPIFYGFASRGFSSPWKTSIWEKYVWFTFSVRIVAPANATSFLWTAFNSTKNAPRFWDSCGRLKWDSTPTERTRQNPHVSTLAHNLIKTTIAALLLPWSFCCLAHWKCWNLFVVCWSQDLLRIGYNLFGKETSVWRCMFLLKIEWCQWC